jgi:hypothetical protein
MADESGGEWLTYAEAGQRFGISPAAARQMSRRRGRQRRTPNAYGKPATILVPADALPTAPVPQPEAAQTANDQVNGVTAANSRNHLPGTGERDSARRDR